MIGPTPEDMRRHGRVLDDAAEATADVVAHLVEAWADVTGRTWAARLRRVGHDLDDLATDLFACADATDRGWAETTDARAGATDGGWADAINRGRDGAVDGGTGVATDRGRIDASDRGTADPAHRGAPDRGGTDASDRGTAHRGTDEAPVGVLLGAQTGKRTTTRRGVVVPTLPPP